MVMETEGPTMSFGCKAKAFLLPVAGVLAAVLSGSPAAAADWGRRNGWMDSGVVGWPATRILYEHRPAPVVRRVIVVHRSYYPRTQVRRWRSPPYHVGWPPRRPHERSRCWLPERYLCG
jgi:hypothetical protein